jgi:hypothetical protein
VYLKQPRDIRARFERVTMRLSRESWVGKAISFPRAVVVGAKSQVKKRYQRLKDRYGRRYTRAMLIITFIGFFSPIPGLSVAVICLVVLIAEIHRAVSRRRMNRESATEYQNIMSIKCDVIVNRSATPEQLNALGRAFWQWGNRTMKSRDFYKYLNNQLLADLIAGRLPKSGQTPVQSVQRADGIHFEVDDNESVDSQGAIARLRREIPDRGVVDIKVAGLSWKICEREMSCMMI